MTSWSTVFEAWIHNQFHESCIKGDLEKVRQYCLDERIKVSYSNRDGMTGLHFASEKGYGQICAVLISKGAYIGDKDVFGRTALDLGNTPDVINTMILCSDGDKEKLLKVLVLTKLGDLDKLNALLEDTGRNGVLFSDRNYRTALHIACCEGTGKHYEIAKLLLKHGANSDAKDKTGHSPYDNALALGNKEFTDLFKNLPSSKPKVQEFDEKPISCLGIFHIYFSRN